HGGLSGIAALMRYADFRSCGKCDDVITASVGRDTARFGETHKCPFGQAFQVTAIQRSIRCNNDHAGAVYIVEELITEGKGTQVFVDLYAVNLQDAAIVALYHHAFGVTALLFLKFPGSCADSTLKTETYGSGACPHTAHAGLSFIGRPDGG